MVGRRRVRGVAVVMGVGCCSLKVYFEPSQAACVAHLGHLGAAWLLCDGHSPPNNVIHYLELFEWIRYIDWLCCGRPPDSGSRH